jgi:hypothetical protein
MMVHVTASHLARIGITVNAHIFFSETKGKDYLGDLVIDGRIIFKIILNKYGGRV